VNKDVYIARHQYSP